MVVYWVRDKEFRASYNNYIKDNHSVKSSTIVRKELDLIRKYWGCPPYHYYRYKLYLKKLSEAELLDYIPPYYYYNIYWESRHIGLDKSKYESKFFQHKLFEKYDIPAIEIIARKIHGNLINVNNEPITINFLIEEQLKTDDDALFFKPEYGRGGNGIVKLTKKSGNLQLNDQAISIENILPSLSQDEDYLIQNRFVQSKKMAEINEYSVNTLRVYSQRKGNEILIPACILRMGVNNSFVDNFAQGGIINIIDVENGNLSEYAESNKVDVKYYEHPRTKYVFSGKKVENWDEIKSKIKEFSSYLTACNEIGWDVAISETGFKILEINIRFGLDIQLVYGGMRRIFGVYPTKYQ